MNLSGNATSWVAPNAAAFSLVSVEPQTPSAIAKETALTPAAVTTLVDRLEARGLVRRRHDTKDRRRVFVEATEKTCALIRKTYRHIAVAGAEMLAAYSLDELAIIRRFVEDALALQRRMTEQFIKSAALTL